MQVRFRTNFFAATGASRIDKTRTASGKLYRANVNNGVHEVPSDMEDHLPSDAVILSGGRADKTPVPEVHPDVDDAVDEAEGNPTFAEADPNRAAVDNFTKVTEAAEDAAEEDIAKRKRAAEFKEALKADEEAASKTRRNGGKK